MICKDPTIGVIFFCIRARKYPEMSRVIFFDFKSGGHYEIRNLLKAPILGKMTTRGNLATLVLIITLGCSHTYVGRIFNAKILLESGINMFFQNLPLTQVVIYL